MFDWFVWRFSVREGTTPTPYGRASARSEMAFVGERDVRSLSYLFTGGWGRKGGEGDKTHPFPLARYTIR